MVVVVDRTDENDDDDGLKSVWFRGMLRPSGASPSQRKTMDGRARTLQTFRPLDDRPPSGFHNKQRKTQP
jgi:hypothetical protein